MESTLDLVARQASFWGRDVPGAAEAVRDRLVGFHPALPLTMVNEAMAWIAGDPEGRTSVQAKGAVDLTETS